MGNRWHVEDKMAMALVVKVKNNQQRNTRRTGEKLPTYN